MSTVTIGSAGATFATLALWEANLAGSAGLKSEAIGLLHDIGAAHAGNTFTGIDTSAYRVTIRPATSAAFWNHVSAESNRLFYDPAYGVAISGNPALDFTDMVVTVSGIMLNSSGANTFALRENASLAGGAHKFNNCIIEQRGGLGLWTGNAFNNRVEYTNVVFIAHRAGKISSDWNYNSSVFTNCTFLNTSGADGVTGILGLSDPADFRNCIFVGFVSSDVVGGTANIGGGNNISTLASASTRMISAKEFWGNATGSNELVNITSAAYDARILPNATLAINNGCAAYAPSVDILNRTRVTPHDIGAWDASASFAPPPPPPPPPPPAASNVYPYNPLGNLVVDLGGLRYY